MQYTEKQKIWTAAIAGDWTYYLAYGGSRSGKTFDFLRAIIVRATKYKQTKHLIVRGKKTTCVNTVWQDLLKIISQSVDAHSFTENKSDHVIKFANGSEIWSGGLDDQTQVDKILGTEWATIYMNEASEIPFKFFEVLKTRLNVNPNETEIKRKFFIDENPPTPDHWTNKTFIEHIDVNTQKKMDDTEIAKYTSMFFHPLDNKENLTKEYLDDLSKLTGMARKRFWEGVFAYNFIGQVYHKFNRDINIDNTLVEVHGAKSWRSWDFGIRDASSIIWAQVIKVPTCPTNKIGMQINIIDEYENTEQDAEHYAAICKAKYAASTWYDAGDPAGSQRNASLESWIGILGAQGIQVRYKTGYSVADMISHANAYIPYLKINADKCPRMLAMFENWGYITDKYGKVPDGSKPIHNEYSHFGTAFYYFVLNAFEPQGKSAKLYIV